MNIVDIVRNDSDLLPSTKETYRTILARYRAIYGDVITIGNVQSWLDSQSCSARTKRLYLAALRLADQRVSLLQSKRPELAGSKFRVGKVRGKRPVPRALSLAESRALLATCEGKDGYSLRDRALIGLGLTRGMRHGALFRLQRPDIDRRGNTARIYLKGGGEHLVPLSEESWEYLEPWLKWKPPVAWQAAPDPAGPLFVEFRTNGRLAYRSIAAMVARRGLQAGLGRLEVHELRHTFITRARLLGWTTLEIAAVTGHVADLEGGSAIIDRVYTDLERASQEWGRGSDRLT